MNRKKLSFSEIDSKTIEGKLLIFALGRLMVWYPTSTAEQVLSSLLDCFDEDDV